MIDEQITSVCLREFGRKPSFKKTLKNEISASDRKREREARDNINESAELVEIKTGHSFLRAALA